MIKSKIPRQRRILWQRGWLPGIETVCRFAIKGFGRWRNLWNFLQWILKYYSIIIYTLLIIILTLNYNID